MQEQTLRDSDMQTEHRFPSLEIYKDLDAFLIPNEMGN